MKNLLLSRNYHVDGTWYEPQKFLENFKSVVRAGYLETTSSAGDWTGYILQKIGKVFHIILFWQTNSYPDSGFDVVTDANTMYSFTGEEPTKKEFGRNDLEYFQFLTLLCSRINFRDQSKCFTLKLK